MVIAEKISEIGNKVTSHSRNEKLEHSKAIDWAASNKLGNISNEEKTIQNETQTLDKPVNAIASEGNIGMEANFPISDINGWQTVSHPRKKKNRMYNTNTQNHNFKIPRKESTYKKVNFSSNLMEKRLYEREYKNVNDKSLKKTLHDSSVGKAARFTELCNSSKTVGTNFAYETSTEFLSSNKNRMNQEFVENPLLETCVTASVQHIQEFDSTSEKEIEQSKLLELKETPMKHSYAEKCILNESLTERQFKNKSAFHRNSRPAQNYRNIVGAHESKPNGLDMTKLKKQKKTKDIISKSESCNGNKNMVNNNFAIDSTIKEQSNKHTKVISVLKPDQNKVNDVINIKEQNQKVASFMNAENLSSTKTDAQDEYKHYKNQPLTKYLEMGKNAENRRCDCDNAEASDILSERYEWHNVEASNIQVERCDWDKNAETSNIPSQRCELDNNVEENGTKSPRCDWENNTESSNIPSQRCDWDNNTEESSVPSQQCDWDNTEASNIESQRYDWDNAEARNIQSQQCDWDNAEVSAIPSPKYDLDNNAEVNAIASQRCEWGNNAEASNIQFQRYDHPINSENDYFLQSESVKIVSLNPENAESGFRRELKGSIILGIPNQSFDNGMASSTYSNQFQSVMNYNQVYYQEHAPNAQGSENSNTRQNNPNAIYNSVVSGMPSRPFALSWTDGGVVYYQYYQNVAPVSYPCFIPVVRQNNLSHLPQFVPHLTCFPYESNLENTVK